MQSLFTGRYGFDSRNCLLQYIVQSIHFFLKVFVSGPVHMPNEFIGVDELMFDTHMIADAIIALACGK